MPEHKPRREYPAVNAGSMADIAFLLLIFFLVTTTISEDSGVLVRLPPWESDPPEKTSHALTVIVNTNDELMVEDRLARPGDLPRMLRDFVYSPSRTPKQAVVSLIHDRGSSYTRYMEVYDALLDGYHQLWDEAATRRYGRGYGELTDREKQEVRRALPLTISEAEPTDLAGL